MLAIIRRASFSDFKKCKALFLTTKHMLNELMNENVYSLKFATFVNENNGHVYVYVIYMKINVVYWKKMLYEE